MKRNSVKVIKWILAIMLALNFIFSLLIAGVNPEAWFFGHKLGGTEATCWLITNGFAGVIIAFSLMWGWKYDLLATFLFFSMDFVDTLLIPVKFFLPSPFFSIGLIISFLGLVMKSLEGERK